MSLPFRLDSSSLDCLQSQLSSSQYFLQYIPVIKVRRAKILYLYIVCDCVNNRVTSCSSLKMN